MDSRLFGFLVALAACCLPNAGYAQGYGTLSFSPAHPTTNDSITVVFTPATGEPDWCSDHSGAYGNNVTVIAFPFPCSNGYGVLDAANIGKLPAGTYQVTWTYTDNFFNDPVPTATLTVFSAPVSVPVFSTWGLLILVCGVVLVRSHMRPSNEP